VPHFASSGVESETTRKREKRSMMKERRRKRENTTKGKRKLMSNKVRGYALARRRAYIIPT